MLFSTLSTLLLSLVSAWAAVVPEGGARTDWLDFQTDILDSYPVADIQWRGFEDFDQDQVFTGPIENVIFQMRQIKGANYTPGFVVEAKNQSTEAEPAFSVAKPILECGDAIASLTAIREGIAYIRQLRDDVICSNAPGACGRISCSSKSGI
ncbi:hypothetical protein F4802DRAFT_592893 [Xylaria palmicola]|nr:hypothetical protein F4802DRAFT_592893 [Xylaria palmicola]